MREGTLTSGFPPESTTVTVEPSFWDTPGFGLWYTTAPAGTVIDFTGSPCRRSMWTLATSARAWASGRLTSPGVGCDGVNAFVSRAATSPPATITASATTARIHHRRRRHIEVRLGPDDARRAAAAALPKGSASKISPGPALVPTGAPAAGARPGEIA